MNKILLISCITIYFAVQASGFYYGSNHLISQNLLDDKDTDSFYKNYNDNSDVIDFSKSNNLVKMDDTGYYARSPESKALFGQLADNADEDSDDVLRVNYLNVQEFPNKEKRFLKSLWNKFRSKVSKDDSKEIEADEEKNDNRDNSPIRPESHSSSSTMSSSAGSIFDDPFYKLKKHCMLNYDKLCTDKRRDMFDLINKCDSLKEKNPRQQIEACNDVVSIYCYVYLSRDINTCLRRSYDMYIPGQKKYSPGNTPATYRPTTTTTSTTTTTRSRSRWDNPTTTPRSRYNPRPSFDESPFNGPVKSVPKSAEELKTIGNYCLRVKTKDENCDKMLKLLKEKFSHCEKKPKTDVDCQSFKMDFCQAFPGFPCCADVLAGRTCKGRQN